MTQRGVRKKVPFLMVVTDWLFKVEKKLTNGALRVALVSKGEGGSAFHVVENANPPFFLSVFVVPDLRVIRGIQSRVSFFLWLTRSPLSGLLAVKVRVQHSQNVSDSLMGFSENDHKFANLNLLLFGLFFCWSKKYIYYPRCIMSLRRYGGKGTPRCDNHKSRTHGHKDAKAF
jgi:hypothetical protein